MANPPIYVECFIDAPLERVWQHTQEPALHQRWDLRFTRIEYLPRPDAREPQRFLYETRIGFGLRIRGEGESSGAVEQVGKRISALRFWSGDSKSLIRTGSGYWQYEPVGEGTRFLTWYDYESRFGWLGAIIDRVLFRPLLGWATAWSFDRLRLWLERGIDPALSAERSLVHTLARVVLGLTWIYQGLVPKILFPDSGELAILQSTGLFRGYEPSIMPWVGVVEAALGLLLIALGRSRWPLVATLVILPVLLIGAVPTNPDVMVTPFNAPSLSWTMAALATIALIAGRDLPAAARCLRRPKGKDA